jgi:hypothetical protein
MLTQRATLYVLVLCERCTVENVLHIYLLVHAFLSCLENPRAGYIILYHFGLKRFIIGTYVSVNGDILEIYIFV